MVEYWLSEHKSLVFSLQHHVKLEWQCTPIVPALWRQRHQGQKFKVILGHITNLKLPGLMRPVSKPKLINT